MIFYSRPEPPGEFIVCIFLFHAIGQKITGFFTKRNMLARAGTGTRAALSFLQHFMMIGAGITATPGVLARKNAINTTHQEQTYTYKKYCDFHSDSKIEKIACGKNRRVG